MTTIKALFLALILIGTTHMAALFAQEQAGDNVSVFDREEPAAAQAPEDNISSFDRESSFDDDQTGFDNESSFDQAQEGFTAESSFDEAEQAEGQVQEDQIEDQAEAQTQNPGPIETQDVDEYAADYSEYYDETDEVTVEQAVQEEREGTELPHSAYEQTPPVEFEEGLLVDEEQIPQEGAIVLEPDEPVAVEPVEPPTLQGEADIDVDVLSTEEGSDEGFSGAGSVTEEEPYTGYYEDEPYYEGMEDQLDQRKTAPLDIAGEEEAVAE